MQMRMPWKRLSPKEVSILIMVIYFDRFAEVKQLKYAPVSGSEPRMTKVQGMVDKMFGDNTKTSA